MVCILLSVTVGLEHAFLPTNERSSNFPWNDVVLKEGQVFILISPCNQDRKDRLKRAPLQLLHMVEFKRESSELAIRPQPLKTPKLTRQMRAYASEIASVGIPGFVEASAVFRGQGGVVVLVAKKQGLAVKFMGAPSVLLFQDRNMQDADNSSGDR